MENTTLLVWTELLKKMMDEEISKCEKIEKSTMQDLLGDLICYSCMFVDLKIKGYKHYSDDKVKQNKQDMKEIIKFFLRMRKNPQMVRELLEKHKSKSGWLRTQEIMEISNKYKNIKS